MVPASGAASAPSSSAPAATPAPPAVTPAPSVQLNQGAAPPAQYTAPPAPGQDFYQYMPYDSWSGGGYKQLQCGYGYQKQADGLCVPYAWVSD